MIVFFQVLFRVLTSSDLWQATLQFGALLLLPALGGVISERSGVVNIAMEGMMLTGAYAGVMVALSTNNLLLGVLGAIIAGGLMALIHAVISINFKANQIVSGIAINIAALGLTNYLLLVQTAGQGVRSLASNLRLPVITWGPLANIPFLGPVLFQQNISLYVAVLILVGIQLLLFRTNIGLRIRAVGEHPQAADTAGVNVRLVRYLCVISSGLLSGLAGPVLALGIYGIFYLYINGRARYIALAPLHFGECKTPGSAPALP